MNIQKSTTTQFHFFTCSCPVFPAPFIEETVFPPFNTTHKNKLKMD